MGAIIAFISAAVAYVPKLIEIGEDALPLILKAREAVNHLGTMTSPTDPEFVALDARVAGLEGNFKDAVAKRLAQDG